MICEFCKAREHEHCLGELVCYCQHVIKVKQECVLSWINDLRGPF